MNYWIFKVFVVILGIEDIDIRNDLLEQQYSFFVFFDDVWDDIVGYFQVVGLGVGVEVVEYVEMYSFKFKKISFCC